jgi:hypothetical protein
VKRSEEAKSNEEIHRSNQVVKSNERQERKGKVWEAAHSLGPVFVLQAAGSRQPAAIKLLE